MHDEHHQHSSSTVDSHEPDPSSGPEASGPKHPSPTKLTSARMPADGGISSLGLLTQLGGLLGMVVAALFAVTMAVGGAGHITGAFFLVAVLSGIRSAFLRTVGSKLLYGTGGEPMRAVHTYLWIAAAHTAVSLLILKGYVTTEQLLQAAAFFAAWPLAMLVFFTRPQVKALVKDGVPHAEDYGFEGAAVLMTLFGIMGTLFAAYILKNLLRDLEVAFSTPASGIIVLVVMALLARSIIHTLAGLNGISGATFEECNASAGRYYNFGIVSSICIGMTLFVVILMSAQNMGVALTIGGITTPLLLAWPQILRRLYSERNFHVYLEDTKAQTYQRAPDAGLIALGWTLVAVSLFGLGESLIDALFSSGLTDAELRALFSVGGQDAVDFATRSQWWSVGVSGLQLFAGIELIRMSERHKLAAMIYAVVSIAVVIYLVWPAVDSIDRVFASAFAGATAMSDMSLILTGFPLILAVGTIVLVNRVTIPSAVIHVRKNPTRAQA